MAESSIAMAEGTPGKRSHTWNRTISAVSVEDEFVQPGEFPYPTYTVYAQNVSMATAASHVMQLMSGASTIIRIRRIRAAQLTATAGSERLEIVRLTTAGTGGTAITARPYDTADSAAVGAGMTLPTVKGTEGVFLGSLVLNNYTAVGAVSWAEWRQMPNSKPIMIPAGTTNGIALKSSGLAATAVDVEIEFVETAFV